MNVYSTTKPITTSFPSVEENPDKKNENKSKELSPNVPSQNQIKVWLEAAAKGGITGHYTWVLAYDTVNARTIITQSGRPWCITRSAMLSHVQNKEKWAQTLKPSKVFFPKILLDPEALPTLSEAVCKYTEQCRMNKEKGKVSHFTDYNKTRGDFTHLLVTLCKTRNKAEDRLKILKTIKEMFPDIIVKAQWELLGELFKNSESISEEQVRKIIFSYKATPETAVQMACATIFCGELPFVMGIFKEMETMSKAAKQALPVTLAERFKICAIRIDKKGISEFPMCLKCQQLWPVYEKLYQQYKLK